MDELTKKTMVEVAPELSKCQRDAANFKMLVCGRTGVGKSFLINCLVGKPVRKVAGPATKFHSSGEAFGPCTTEVECVTLEVNGVTLQIYDSPGLQDGTANESQYLADMYRKCVDVDLVLYCLEMPNVRWSPEEMKAMMLLTEKFGVGFWEKAILVLTKSNMISPPTDHEPSEKEIRDHWETWFTNCRLKFSKSLKTQESNPRVPAEVADGIPAVATATLRRKKLPNGKHFIAEFWVTCLERVSPQSRDNFAKATNITERLIPSGSDSQTSSETKNYNIEFDEDQVARISIAAAAWEGTKSYAKKLAEAGSKLGADVGGLTMVQAPGIGQLIGASVGTVIGGVVGAGLGALVGILKWRKTKK